MTAFSQMAGTSRAANCAASAPVKSLASHPLLLHSLLCQGGNNLLCTSTHQTNHDPRMALVLMGRLNMGLAAHLCACCGSVTMLDKEALQVLFVVVQPQNHVPSSSTLLSTADVEEALEAARRQHLLNVNAPDSGMQVHCLALLIYLLNPSMLRQTCACVEWTSMLMPLHPKHCTHPTQNVHPQTKHACPTWHASPAAKPRRSCVI